MKYLFGPVNSRRLGLSLGIDLVPFKTCSLNCIYCECGATTELTTRIDEYAPTAAVLDELEAYLSPGPALDVVTFSGSGEPTLHRDIGRVIDFIKDRFPRYRVAVLTNATMLWKTEVRRALLRADMVIPSLDAVSEDVFARMLRPAPGVTASKIVEGLTLFSREYSGAIIVEVFIIPGINDGPEELSRIRETCLAVNPASVQLNRLDRPGAEHGIERAGDDRLRAIRDMLAPLNVEIIGEPTKRHQTTAVIEDVRQRILSTLERRPSTLEDLEKALGLRRVELVKVVDVLVREGLLAAETMERGVFYRAVKG